MSLRRKPKREPRIHDYTRVRGWGHDFTIRTLRKGGKVIEGSLWTQWRLSEGDLLLLPNGTSGTSTYRVTETQWCRDPDDMYHFTAKHDPKARPK